MRNALPSSDVKRMVNSLKAGDSITKTAKTFNVSKTYVESFAKYYRDKKELKKAPKD